MADQDSFTLYALHIDPKTKAISSSSSAKAITEHAENDKSDKSDKNGTAPSPPARITTTPLDAELNALNELHRSILGIENGMPVPPPPMPVNPKRTAQVQKLRDSGNAEFRKGQFANAIRFYTLGLEMAFKRPVWEPAQMVLEDVVSLYANRAQAHMALQAWTEGAADAELSVEARKTGNAKAWWRRGKCLMELGRLGEAQAWVKHGLEMEGEEPDLQALRAEIETKLIKATESL
ncbi:translocation protein sec72 [Ophiostoma piceae UAMH 11346]|uniref:Translocation protein sec72 n=1 Tax=Ophiostoma piceae (strain UAMH 11346) TaxID=1262450 RepID=S3C4Z6_OPHP1|nr:translocation protein sec72 [Ophiostoma piceae UAMH 11346]